MKEQTSHPLKPGHVKVTAHAEEVLSCTLGAGLVVCALKPGKAGAFYIHEGDEKRLEPALQELLGAMGSDVQVKIVGSDSLRSRARQWLQGKKGVTVTGDSQASNFELFVFASTGRVRLRETTEVATVHPISPAAASAPAPQSAAKAQNARVLIVDDSKTIRNLLRQILSSDPSIEVVGEAERPSQVEELIEKLKPSVITLDINMPEMDGVTLLGKYLPKYHIPTVMVTAISLQEGDQVLRALNLGAVDYIQKPSMEELRVMAPVIIEKIKVAATITVKGEAKSKPAGRRLSSVGNMVDASSIVAVGASTGGVQALENFFSLMPEKIPPTVVVQHIPPVFSAAFAKRLNEKCPFEVLEAKDGDEVKAGRVLIAPGGTQMKLERKDSKMVVRVFDGAPVNRHKPSVDVLFDSVAELVGKHAIGVILTGMGADGAKGLLKMRKAGARTIAQDKDSCVVYGMPRAAVELGAAEEVKPLTDIPEVVLRWLVQKKSA